MNQNLKQFEWVFEEVSRLEEVRLRWSSRSVNFLDAYEVRRPLVSRDRRVWMTASLRCSFLYDLEWLRAILTRSTCWRWTENGEGVVHLFNFRCCPVHCHISHWWEVENVISCLKCRNEIRRVIEVERVSWWNYDLWEWRHFWRVKQIVNRLVQIELWREN